MAVVFTYDQKGTYSHLTLSHSKGIHHDWQFIVMYLWNLELWIIGLTRMENVPFISAIN